MEVLALFEGPDEIGHGPLPLTDHDDVDEVVLEGLFRDEGGVDAAPHDRYVRVSRSEDFGRLDASLDLPSGHGADAETGRLLLLELTLKGLLPLGMDPLVDDLHIVAEGVQRRAYVKQGEGDTHQGEGEWGIMDVPSLLGLHDLREDQYDFSHRGLIILWNTSRSESACDS